MTIREENEKLLKQYSGSCSSALRGAVDMDNQRIKSIQFEPLCPVDELPMKRRLSLTEAVQVKIDDSGVDCFVEAMPPYPGHRMIFVKDVEECGLKRGDTVTLHDIKSGRVGVEDKYVVEKDNGALVRGIPPDACVFDSNYKYLYFCKVLTGDRHYFEDQGEYNKITEESIRASRPGHFTEDSNPVLFAIRYKGQLTKEIAAQAREQFSAKFPGYVKLEEKGTLSVLMLSECPSRPNVSQKKNDCYVRFPKKCADLKLETATKKLKM